MNNIFVGNLSFVSTKEDVRKLFEKFGLVANVVIMERKKGKSRGYGFVDMPNEEEKNAAIAALEGREFMERVLSVMPVIPKAKAEYKPKKFKPVQEKWTSDEEVSGFDERESKPWIKKEDNRSSKPYQRDDRGSKPYQRDDRPSKPYSQGQGSAKPYRQDDRSSKPYQRDDRGPKPYQRDDRPSKPYSQGQGAAKPYRRDDRDSRGFRDSGGGAKPYVKRNGQKRAYTKPEGIIKAPSKLNAWGNPKKDYKPFRKDDRSSKPYRRDDREGKKFEGQSKPSEYKKESGFKSPQPGGAFKMFHKVSGKPRGGAKPWPKKGQARS